MTSPKSGCLEFEKQGGGRLKAPPKLKLLIETLYLIGRKPLFYR